MDGDFVLALHALVFLYHKRTRLSSGAIADNVCTNPARVRKVMVPLVRAGLAETKEGRTGGGYRYRPDRPVTLLEIADALETKFAGVRWKSGAPDRACMISSGMGAFVDGLSTTLEQTCREKLSAINVADVEKFLIDRKKENDHETI